MVGSNGRKGKITPVDEDYMRRQAELHATMTEDRQVRAYLRRERSSAYWFAATKWGILGLVAGIIFGGVGMYYASMSTIDMAQDAISKGEMIANFRREQAQPTPSPTQPTP
ncbi:MAG: hypothetical protein IV086_01990 [Hyphomonadaceae bacterium]|nr:MAG: hypothetical protein FD160_1084 [Caulobacteraceae bacterium]MBT9444451.1 hypothetical protein [Hyphomonadaceae bacterium]TPW03714.1 MAG: hypothetical protein FD124_2901 [Alphaproteobacteria bacterium]